MFILTYTIFVEKLTGSNAHEINRTLIAKDDKSRTAVSSATLCDGTYYNIWVDFDTRTTYFLSLDVTSSSAKIQDVQTDSLFHALACDPHQEGSLLAVASDASGSGAVFSLKRYDVRTGNESYVAHFPASDGVVWGGDDGIFSFNKDGTEVWASWPRDVCPHCSNAKRGGHIHVMNTATGEIEKSLDLKKRSILEAAGTPYYVDLDANRAVFEFGSMDLKWVDLDIESDEVKYKDSDVSASKLWSSSQPFKTCGDIAYTVPMLNHDVRYLIGTKITDGSQASILNLEEIFEPDLQANFGGVAC